MKIKNKVQFLLLFFLFLLAGIFLSEKINLITADLGRHLKNGELILSGRFKEVVSTNFYSYTFPDFSFINHHWGSGVIFYLINQVFGFKGLSLFFVGLSLITFWLFFDLAKRKSNFTLAFFSSILFLPLIVYRREIRPEVFSYFFCGLFFWLLFKVKTKKLAFKWLYLLPIFELIWINLHVYSFWGFILIGLFLLDDFYLFLKQKKKLTLEFKHLILVLLMCFSFSFVNPAGARGVFYPLNIFNDYGYRLFENQSVLFIDRVIGYYPANLYFKISFGVLVLSFCWAIKHKRFSLSNFCLFLVISYLGWSAVRNFTLYAFFALVILCFNFAGSIDWLEKQNQEKKLFLTVFIAVFFLFGLYLLSPTYWFSRNFGLGLTKDNNASADFFKANKLKGPVFNNYDIGGYLIYNLYPQERVFVDNRPETYPKEFFTQTYVPMQENREEWLKVLAKDNFNSVFFYWHDLTPWSQQFLGEIIKDKDWVPVYVDQWALILVRNNLENKEIIEKFRLPSEIFTQVRN